MLMLPRLSVAQDTARVTPLFVARDAHIVAFFTLATVGLFPLDRTLADRVREQPLQDNDFLQHSAAFFRYMGGPGPLLIGASMYAAGRVTRTPRLADLGLHGTEAVALATTITGVGKGLGGRARPLLDISRPGAFRLGRGFPKGNDGYRSFPSGHAATAFAAASAVTSELKRWHPRSVWYVAPVMYGGASLVGISRMYDNKHWASDVVLGAAIGTFSGLKIVTYSHRKGPTGLDRRLLGRVVVVPAGDGIVAAWAIER